MGFETVRLNALPVWLDGPNARAYVGALGGLEDSSLALVKQGAKSRFAKTGCVETTDDDGLDALGSTRRLPRAPGESGAAYLARCSRAPISWHWAGTASGLLQPFEPFIPEEWASYRFATEEQIRLDPVRDAVQIAEQEAFGRVSPDLWLKAVPPTCASVTVYSNGEVDGYWDGNEHWYTRIFWHVDSTNTPPTMWDVDANWDDPGNWDDGGLWDTTMTEAEANYLRTMIRRYKSPGSYPTSIAVWLSGTPEDGFWFSPGEWDDGGLWANELTSDPLYITVGHVWGEEAWLGAYGDFPLTDVWSATDDGLPPYRGYFNDPEERP